MKRMILMLAAGAALAGTMAAQYPGQPPVCEERFLPDGTTVTVCHPLGTPPPVCAPRPTPEGGWILVCNQ